MDLTVIATFAPRLQTVRAEGMDKFRYRMNTNDGENTRFRNDRVWAKLMAEPDVNFYQSYPDNWMSQTTGYSDMEDKVMRRDHADASLPGGSNMKKKTNPPPANKSPSKPKPSNKPAGPKPKGYATQNAGTAMKETQALINKLLAKKP